jgi:hypothetical protein
MKVGDDASFDSEVVELGVRVRSEAGTHEVDDCCELTMWYVLPDLRTEQWQWMFERIGGWSITRLVALTGSLGARSGVIILFGVARRR